MDDNSPRVQQPLNFDEFEIDSPLTLADIERLAQKQVAPLPVPDGYQSQLRAHVKEFPKDVRFQLIPHAGDGFGVIKCLEPGCSVEPIVLKPRTKKPDGGRASGVGGLAEFQSHIFEHPNHERLRDTRLKAIQTPDSQNETVEPKMTETSTTDTQPTRASVEISQNDDIIPTFRSQSSLPTSVSTSPSNASSKRAPSSPPPNPRLAKKAHLSRGGSNTPHKPSARQTPVIDLDTFDDNLPAARKPIRTNTASPSKSASNVIDIDTSDGDSEPKIIIPKKNNNNKSTPKPEPIDVSDEDLNMVWVEDVGLVPLSRFGNPDSKTKSTTSSRLSSSILGNATPRQGRSTPADIKPASARLGASPYGLPDRKSTPKPRADVPLSAAARMKQHLTGGLTPSSSAMPKPQIKADSPFLNPPPDAGSSQFKQESTVYPFPNTRGIGSSPFMKSPKRESTVQPFGHSNGIGSSSPFMKSDPSIDHNPMPSGSGHGRGLCGDDSSDDDDLIRNSNPFDPMGNLLPPSLFQNRLSITDSLPYAQADLRPEETHDFLQQAVQNLNFAHNATVAGAREGLGMTDDRLDGMAIPLMAHQIIGIDWMIKQENSKNLGGILGDEMGLGKTIQMIATMVKNRSTDSKKKATLILAPLALLTQWKEEIAERSTCDLSVLIYHSSTKVAERKKISHYDVVITTLDTLRVDWNESEDVENPKKPKGLYKIDWYRIVIDEAQIIRNRQSKKSRAVCALKGIFRWCLTGTPIFNTLWDIYPYLRFLRIRPYNDAGRFRDHITMYEKKRPNLATDRAQAVLATCMLRRQKNTQLDGKPLIVLPPKHKEDVMLDMTVEEREIYEMLEKRAQQKFNVFLRRGTVLKNFACILVLLLRLRQACGHPSLAIEQDDDTEAVNDPSDRPEFNDPHLELNRAIETLGQDWVHNTKNKFQDEADELVKAEQQNSNEAAAPECPICNDPLDDTSRITKCGHVFCESCLDTLLMQAQPMMDETANTDPSMIPKPCPNCRAPFRKIDTFLKKAFLPPVDELDGDEDLLDAGVKINHKMRNGVIGDDSDDENDTKPDSKGKEKEKIEKYTSDLIPSTKLVWLLEQIVQVKKENPDDKFIVVSQWTGMLQICSGFLRERGFRYVCYQGDMNTVERNEAVSKFKKRPEYGIMLMSLKCGGVGLNLTCANRVISLDLAWSPASENQAFDRAHRFGQMKPVHVKRVMINNTVEQRINKLQLGKQAITDSALGEGSGKKLKRMTVSELANLFNLNTRGETLS
ncbi:hypothetical protein PSTG_04932 [Puccinia striiformis f. sp. tritici PST-78]|uniref:Uncharacterized protein n=1 Tax=Puccinia striiformis f. sp. tritici PST-78 TaxID=1165861 RepID=A0A0L0VRA0_9BASI|nr:hypothetical protein PSTG_04932 [Puccinia striiformis f. sp. tritici PST-78]